MEYKQYNKKYDKNVELKEEFFETKLLQSISRELIQEDNVNKLYERIIEVAMRGMKSDYATMQMLHIENSGEEKLELLAYIGLTQESASFWKWVNTRDSGSSSGEALRKKERVIVPNVEEESFMKGTKDIRTYLENGIKAVQSTPLYSRNGNILGMISTHWKNPYEPSERELRFIDVLARQAADLIEQKQSKENLKESEEKYRTLFYHMNEGFFLGEIVFDKDGKAIDYLFVDANPALEKIIGLKPYNIVGRRGNEIFLEEKSIIEKVGEVALTGKSTTFEIFSQVFNRYFSIKAFSPQKGQFACLIEDITKQKELEKEMKNGKELFESVIENMYEALIIFNKEGKIEFINAEARSLYNIWRNQKVIGNDKFNLKNTIVLEGNNLIRRILKGEKIKNKKIAIKILNKNKYIEFNTSPIFDEKGNFKFSIVSYRDISELMEKQLEIKRHQEEILKAEKEKRETAENAMKVKDEFIYLITHEFKTPITVISSVLQTIESLFKDEIPGRVEKYLKMIKVNTNRQLRLVNNLLDITRLNSGHIKLRKNNVDIIYVTKSIVNSVNEYAKQKHINLSFRSTIRAKEFYLDEEKYERIILNLLSNALKFTPEGGNIYVYISSERLKTGKFIRISVRDEGIGIPPEKQEVIFERFGQADTSLSRQAEGTGLGLHLVKILVNMFGGKILLKSRLGEGSKFTVLLPDDEYDPEQLKCNESNEEFMSSDERIIQATTIEFSDIYFE